MKPCAVSLPRRSFGSRDQWTWPAEPFAHVLLPAACTGSNLAPVWSHTGWWMDATTPDGAYFDTCRVIGRSDRLPVRFTAVPVATTSMISSER